MGYVAVNYLTAIIRDYTRFGQFLPFEARA